MASTHHVLNLIERGRTVLQGLGSDFHADAARLEELTERLQEGRFHLAVLGQFKRGKSTLLNALLGEEVLPAAVVPLTARPTFIRHGKQRRARVVFEDDRPPMEVEVDDAEGLRRILTPYVSEEENPDNRERVAEVEVFHPADLLARGVVLIDTPGIGSTHQHNTLTTRTFLPQCDAALFMVSADPPITEVELEFLQEVQQHVPRIFFVLNKMDLLRGQEQTEAADFLRRVLKENGRSAPRVFEISAREALKARQSADRQAWEASGMEEVRHHLVDFLASEKMEVLQEAIAGKANAQLEESRLRAGITINALSMPVEDLEARLQAFDEKMAEAEAQRTTAADLLSGDRKRLHESVEEAAGAMRERAEKHFKQRSSRAMDGAGLIDEEEVLQQVAEELPDHFSKEMRQEMEHFDRRVIEALKPHQERADALIREVREHAAELFDVPYRAPETEGAFTIEQEPYWLREQFEVGMLGDAGSLLERLMPRAMRHKRIERRILRKVGQLVTTNVEKFRWTTLQQIDRTFRRFQSELDERLQQTIKATRGAAEAALHRRAETQAAIEGEVEALQSAQKELSSLQEDLQKIGEQMEEAG